MQLNLATPQVPIQNFCENDSRLCKNMFFVALVVLADLIALSVPDEKIDQHRTVTVLIGSTLLISTIAVVVAFIKTMKMIAPEDNKPFYLQQGFLNPPNL